MIEDISLKHDIKNVLIEWHIGTEDMFDDEDLEEMTTDIIKVINKKRLL